LLIRRGSVGGMRTPTRWPRRPVGDACPLIVRGGVVARIPQTGEFSVNCR
jgi:hypothetical protein